MKFMEKVVFNTAKKLKSTSLTSNENNEDESDTYEDDYEHKPSSNDENSISNLAKKLIQTKLEKSATESDKPLSIKTSANTKKIEADTDKDDLDLELDIDLENVDTTDVNLDDDISD